MPKPLIESFALTWHTFVDGPFAGKTVPFNLGTEIEGRSVTFTPPSPGEGGIRLNVPPYAYVATGEEVIVDGERTLVWRLDQ